MIVEGRSGSPGPAAPAARAGGPRSASRLLPALRGGRRRGGLGAPPGGGGDQSGFDLAELDLRLRGPGDVAGLRQHGLPRCAPPTSWMSLSRCGRAVPRSRGWSTTRRSPSTRPSMRRCTATAPSSTWTDRRWPPVASRVGSGGAVCSPPAGMEVRRPAGWCARPSSTSWVHGWWARGCRSLRRGRVGRIRGAQPGSGARDLRRQAPGEPPADRRHRPAFRLREPDRPGEGGRDHLAAPRAGGGEGCRHLLHGRPYKDERLDGALALVGGLAPALLVCEHHRARAMLRSWRPHRRAHRSLRAHRPHHVRARAQEEPSR